MDNQLKNREKIAFLDMGESKLACMIANKDNLGELVCYGLSCVESFGIKNGNVVDANSLISSIKQVVDDVEAKVKLRVQDVVISISGVNTNSYFVKSNLAFGFEKNITLVDIQRATKLIDMQKYIDTKNETVIHIIPIKYVINNEYEVVNPVGLLAHNISILYHIVSVPSLVLADILNTVKGAGFNVRDIVVGGYASGLATLDKDDFKIGAMVVDIGKSAVNVGVFNSDNFIYSFATPIAINYIIEHICKRFNIRFNDALQLVIKYGAEKVRPMDYSQYIDIPIISSDGGEDSCAVPKADILNIIYQIEQMSFEVIRKYTETKDILKYINRIIITGGGANIKGVIAIAEAVFNMPVRIAKPFKILGCDNVFWDERYATLFGMVRFYFEKSSLMWEQGQYKPKKNKWFLRLQNFIKRYF